jgi:hypothetical protein
MHVDEHHRINRVEIVAMKYVSYNKLCFLEFIGNYYIIPVGCSCRLMSSGVRYFKRILI